MPNCATFAPQKIWLTPQRFRKRSSAYLQSGASPKCGSTPRAASRLRVAEHRPPRRARLARLHPEGPKRSRCRPAASRGEPAGEAGISAVDKQCDGAAERSSGRHRRSVAGAPDFDEQPMEPSSPVWMSSIGSCSSYSRDRGTREAQLGAALGEGTEDIGFRNRVAIVFTAAPSHDVTLRVHDERGQPVVASFLVEDTLGRVYPARSKRLAPDFFFQPQIYRADGETLRLPAGEYTFTVVAVRSTTGSAGWSRRSRERTGDSDRIQAHEVDGRGVARLVLRRSPRPRRGLQPLREPDRRRQARGHDAARPRRGAQRRRRAELGAELLSPAAVLRGEDNHLSTASTLLRYDVEVSGFPSSHCGHLVLLRLKDQDYPETRQIEDWPSWDLPILKWAKAQGAIAGFAHSGLGLQVKSRDLPELRDVRRSTVSAPTSTSST